MEEAKLAGREVAACPVTGSTLTLRGDESRIDPEIFNNPYPFYGALREQKPVYHDAKLDMWLVTRYDDAMQVLNDNDNFSMAMAFEDNASKYQEEFEEIMRRDGGGVFDRIPMDGPDHTRTRRLMLQLFTSRQVKDLEPRIRQIVIDLVEALAERGEGDGIRDIGVPLTARIICEQLGLDFDEVGPTKIAKWSRAKLAQMGRLQTHDEMVANAQVLCEMQQVLISTIKARMEEPRDDMISRLIAARVEEEGRPKLDFPEIVSCVSSLLIAGNDTTAAALANLMLALATEPGLVPRLREMVDDDRMMIRFAEEILRTRTPVHGLWRFARRDVEVGGATIPAGTQVCVMFASANMDESRFPCPVDIDVSRENGLSHLAFGAGIHRCIGAPLARMEIKVAIQEIVARLDDIKLVIPVEDITYQHSLATHTVESLPLAFSRRN
jgi:cytochrome P450